ncbi:MAG TPA: fumarylacetoacetate hydrolase family protein, partial [Tepidisphaeraceae bacterium]|nr:fumarylacetoacetate hydrolase family protein [Tepidisphaeraceae bacterium]
MRIIRFISQQRIFHGEQIDNDHARRIEGDLFGQFTITKDILRVEKLLAPLVPTDILCIGLNYREHAAEGGSPVPKVPMLFIKASNTLNNPGDPILIPRMSSQIDYEAELVVVIAKD